MYLQMTYEMHKTEVPLLAGTDVGENPLCHPSLGVFNELALMVKAGLSPADALKKASMLLTKSNPFKDTNNLHTIRMVINKGKMFTQTDREKLLEETNAFF